jgi:hypothetical protein
MAGVQTSELNAKLAPLNVLPWNFATDRSSEDDNFNKTIFAKSEKYERGGRLIFKINILFYDNNSWTVVFKTNEILYNER